MNQYLRPVTLALFLAALAFSANSTATAAVAVTRGPYLQQGTTNSAVVRWRTDVATASYVRYGTTPGSFMGQAGDATLVTDHIVAVTGLQPDTKYYYEFGTGSVWFPGDTNDFFTTAPLIGTRKPTRVWVLGDSGNANATAAAVASAYANYTRSRPTDVWLMLGDNAYGDGTDAQHQAAVFNMYPTFLQNTFLWPAIGNHDAHTANAAGHIPFFDIFTLPTRAEAGGVPSGTERYYSFDYANIHFICLDSMTSDRGATGAMALWLVADLAATTQDWLVAYWHHPPYSKGSHNSDSEIELIQMRQNFVPILESYGVDLVLAGHSHSYERSYLIDGHYGASSTFTPAMKKNGGNGRMNETGPYTKSGGLAGHEGAVYTVAGCSSGGGSASPHPAMFVSGGNPGSLVIDVVSNRLDLVFLTQSGAIGDYFTILKPVPIPPNPPTAPTNLLAVAFDATTINLSWNNTSADTLVFKVERSTNGTDFSLLSTVSASVTNGSDAGLLPATTYHYRVRASNAAGDSAPSDVASATTLPPPPDTTAPAAVTNLFPISVTSNALTLLWTAPGDDGNSGTATSYDVRGHTEFITESNWASATPIPGAPAPAAGGNVQSFSIGGLAPGALYFFALKTSDETNNLSPLSNIASARTPVPGIPLAPTNLIAAAVATNQLNISWADASDNEDAFHLERSTNGLDFLPLAAVAAGVTTYPDPDVLPATTYWYRVAASNSVAASPNSTPATATTPAIIPPDSTPPAAITNLAIQSVTSNSVTLTWKAPGDDANLGTATLYELRLSTALITEANWAAATPVTGLPTPLPAGTTQTVTLVGIDSTKSNFFAMKTVDENSNLSPLSNIPSTPAPGLPAPWRDLDIGAVGLRGTAAHTNGTFTVTGAGAGITGSADGFHYLLQPATGDCEIIARLKGQQNTSTSARAGVMIRESTNANSRVAMLALTPAKKVVWLRRTSASGTLATTTALGSSWTAPVWLRVTRTNNTFSAWHSTNGTNWIASPPKTFTMGTNTLIGLGVTSASTSRLNTSTFDRVTALP